MDAKLLSTLLDPAILFFFFGLFAGAIRSNLEIPAQIAKFLSLYLLLAIGFKGGVSLATTGFTPAMGWALLAAIILAFVIPAYAFVILRTRLNPFDAAAIAATYGSVSAVTFITAVGWAERQGVAFGGYMTVALVLMESPAIIMAVLLANMVRTKNATGSPGQAAANVSVGKVLQRGVHRRGTPAAPRQPPRRLPHRRGRRQGALALHRAAEGPARLLPARHGPPGRDTRPRAAREPRLPSPSASSSRS